MYLCVSMLINLSLHWIHRRQYIHDAYQRYSLGKSDFLYLLSFLPTLSKNTITALHNQRVQTHFGKLYSVLAPPLNCKPYQKWTMTPTHSLQCPLEFLPLLLSFSSLFFFQFRMPTCTGCHGISTLCSSSPNHF